MNPNLQSRGRDLGNTLLYWWMPQVIELGLVSFDWSKQMTNQPGYPCNPRSECPRVLFRAYRMDHDDAKTLCQTSFTYVCSAWYQLRQTPGEAHQQILSSHLDILATPFLRVELELANSLAQDWLKSLKVLQCQTVIHDELKNPRGDHGLTVSMGEVNLILEGEYR